MKSSSEKKKLVEPPEYLDGARVIMWAWSGKKPFGYLPYIDGSSSIEIYGLAICRYGSSGPVYRFSCDRKWVVQNDMDYDSVEEALELLPDQYKQLSVEWINKEN
jgi:hypothetical protein